LLFQSGEFYNKKKLKPDLFL